MTALVKLHHGVEFRAAHEDEEFLAYRADAWGGAKELTAQVRGRWQGESASYYGEKPEAWIARMAASRKLWLPGETLHRTPGGNNIVLPLPASLTVAWDKMQAEAVREAKRIIREAARAGRPLPRELMVRLPIAGGAGPSAWTFQNWMRTNVLSGDQAIGTDSFKMALFLSTTNITATAPGTPGAYSGATNESGTTNTGYTTGGVAVTEALSGTTTVTVSITDTSWVAGTATLVVRIMAVYEVAHNIQAWATADSTPADVTTQNGNTFLVSGANNLLTLA